MFDYDITVKLSYVCLPLLFHQSIARKWFMFENLNHINASICSTFGKAVQFFFFSQAIAT